MAEKLIRLQSIDQVKLCMNHGAFQLMIKLQFQLLLSFNHFNNQLQFRYSGEPF